MASDKLTFGKTMYAGLWVGVGIGAGMIALYGINFAIDKIKAMTGGSK
jgi:hypothetical protein